MLAATELTFAYRRNGFPVLNAFSHDFRPAAVTTITGASGSGKSTLLYLIGLMLTPLSGGIFWRGRNASELPDAERARLRAERVGFVFQDALLDLSRSVLDNVLEGGLYAGLPRHASEERALTLLARFGVEARADHRPGEISGGQAQRVALCRALIKRPELILADEPSGNLDEASADVVWEALREAAHEGATVVVATHNRERAAAGDASIRL